VSTIDPNNNIRPGDQKATFDEHSSKTTESSGIDFFNQADPAMLLLQYATKTQDLEIGIQSGVGMVLQAWSEGATAATDAGDNALMAQSSSMAGMTGNQLTQANAKYTAMQAAVSNLNNQYSNVMQGGGTELTNLTEVESQNLQLCSIAVDSQNNRNNLIMAWGS